MFRFEQNKGILDSHMFHTNPVVDFDFVSISVTIYEGGERS
jgi:hypothetical protein